MSQPAVIVDPYSSGSALAAAFGARGVACVAVISEPEVPAVALSTWHPQDFVAIHAFQGDLAALAAHVAAHNPLCVVAGSEIGVEFADALAELVLPGNGNVPARSRARRDKHEMALALREAGVPHLRHVCSDRAEDVEAWLREHALEDRRLVVKPPKSAGTDDVHMIAAGADWRPAFDHILGKVNLIGQRNHAVLVQEFAAGTEYIVDTYSVDGRHGLVEVCRYAKGSRGDRVGIYDRVDFLAPDAPEVAMLYDYTRRVLDAVGIRNGAGHAEVMLTADGPVLIEIGARLAGGMHQDLSRLATGDSQLDRYVAHHVDGAYRASYELRRHVRAAFLSSPRAGVLRNAEILDALEELPAVHGVHAYFANGDLVPATVDFTTPLGLVILAGDDEPQIRATYGAVKDLEAQLRVEDPQDATDPRLTYAEA